jgi:hypothetical protein
MRDYLVYTSAGKAANIKQWYASAHRNYDIWVTNYSSVPSLNKKYADYYNERKGSKFENLQSIYREHVDILSNYKAIWVADDDIIISPQSLSALFRTLGDMDLWLLQPAFSRFGKISHKVTERRFMSNLRFTSFVEETCPIFRTDKLLDFLSVYRPELTRVFGIDWWYTDYFGLDHQNRYAISDKYYCINPRDFFKPGGRREINLLNSSQEQVSMCNDVLRELGLARFEYKEYQKIPLNLIVALSSLPVFTLEVIFALFLPLLSKLREYYRKWQ